MPAQTAYHAHAYRVGGKTAENVTADLPFVKERGIVDYRLRTPHRVFTSAAPGHVPGIPSASKLSLGCFAQLCVATTCSHSFHVLRHTMDGT